MLVRNVWITVKRDAVVAGKSFVYYAIEDADCAEALRTKNNDLIKLRLMVLAEKYMALQNQKTPDTPNHEN